MMSLKAYIRLMRPANIITAIADIMMGFAASGAFLALFPLDSNLTSDINVKSFVWLVLATIGLYGGGVVFNDVFDAELDRKERPERPIPSGQATMLGAIALGTFLLVGGVMAAWQVTFLSAVIAVGISICALLYDWKGKHLLVLGPVNMGSCRGGNLLLGMSAVPFAVEELWYLSFIPIVYISAITMISRGEVNGGNSSALKGAIILYSLVILSIISLNILPQFKVVYSLPFLLLFAYLIFPPLFNAMPKKDPASVMQAVKAGVLALIVMNASIAAGFAGWQYGLIVLFLLPLSRYVAKNFAVT